MPESFDGGMIFDNEDDKPAFASSSRDPAAFETFFRTHYPALCDFVDSYVHSPETARDLVQDVFLKLWQRHDSTNPPPLTAAYLYTAARNRALQHIRHGRVVTRFLSRVAPEAVRQAAAADEEVRAREVAQAIDDAIGALPTRCREVFLLSREQGLSYHAIAQVLGISVKTVETQMWRALKSLRERLAPYLAVIAPLTASVSDLIR